MLTYLEGFHVHRERLEERYGDEGETALCAPSGATSRTIDSSEARKDRK
jgi:hypothetical protein